MKILVVEDEPAVLKQLKNFLTAIKDSRNIPYEVTTATNHTEALQLLSNPKVRFDAVITDMHMGNTGEEGLEVLKSLAQKSPVTIVLTAYPTIRNCVDALRVGAWDYLEKNPEDGSDAYVNLQKSLDAARIFRSNHRETAWSAADSAWIKDNMAEFKKTYPADSVIAVLDRQVVAHAGSYAELVQRLEGNFPLAQPAIISISNTTI